MGADEDERLQTEIELLKAMYPENIGYDTKARELKYLSEEGTFVVRLPSGYPNDKLPMVISAGIGRSDARAQVKELIRSLAFGDEVLDSLVAHFAELVTAKVSEASSLKEVKQIPPISTEKATIIIWLHHLLNTNKRKLALSPSSEVSGITKPGYPGVLIYSGPTHLVHDHVSDLKQQNWQAFQVRLESEEEWKFEHGEGMREVESTGEVVAAVGEERKAEVMGALKIG